MATDIKTQKRGENQAAKRAGIVYRIYRWKLTASRSHVSPQQNYAPPGKVQGAK
jgi:hypothetical protein